MMAISTSTLCLVFFVALSLALESEGVSAFPPQGFPPKQTASMLDTRAKRRVFDSSCNGLYDREIFSQLDRVCEDCYNLYRKPHVATECRRDCYNSEVFESCVRDLSMHEFLNDYKEMAHLVAGRK